MVELGCWKTHPTSAVILLIQGETRWTVRGPVCTRRSTLRRAFWLGILWVHDWWDRRVGWARFSRLYHLFLSVYVDLGVLWQTEIATKVVIALHASFAGIGNDSALVNVCWKREEAEWGYEPLECFEMFVKVWRILIIIFNTAYAFSKSLDCPFYHLSKLEIFPCKKMSLIGLKIVQWA